MKEIKTNIFMLMKKSRSAMSLHIPLDGDFLHRITSNGVTLFEGSLFDRINSLHEELDNNELYMCCGDVDIVAIACDYSEEDIDEEKQEELERAGAWHAKLPNGSTLYNRNY